MGSLIEMKLDRELGKPTLPKPTDPLVDHREAARALRVLYPGIKITGRSIRMQDGARTVREIKL